MKVEWTEPAEADLREIYDYIARDAPYYAEQFVDRIIEATGKLKHHPQIGRHVPEADERDDVRELIFQNYRIIYLVTPDCIYVATVVHGSRNLTTFEPKPWEVV